MTLLSVPLIILFRWTLKENSVMSNAMKNNGAALHLGCTLVVVGTGRILASTDRGSIASAGARYRRC